MDFVKVPVGFGMLLAQNEMAMAVYAGMAIREKQMVLEKARHARSEGEMQQIVDTLANSPM